MKNSKKYNLFCHIRCNIILVLTAVIIGICAVFGNRNTVSASNSEYNGTIYAGDKKIGKVSLMVNVYWGTEYVLKMLDIFEANGVKTTFFVGGTWVRDNLDVFKKIIENGHEIGSHGYNHKEHGKLDYSGNYKEIKMCHDEVKSQSGITMELFAPPGGSYNKSTVSAASDLGYKTIMWTRDTIDWRDHDASLILRRAVTGMNSGDLILMHPTASTVEALNDVLIYAKSHNLKISPVSETLGL